MLESVMLNQLIDLTGKRFGRLTVQSRAPSPNKKTFWLCKCDCGNIKPIRADYLTRRENPACGCLRDEQAVINVRPNHKHKLSGTRLYRKWQNMKKRCLNPAVHRYERYGGRGIEVCEEWIRNFEPFRDWALTSGYRDGLSIDRIDNDGNYEPSNCRWVDDKVQSNNRSTTCFITHNGRTQSMLQWCEELGLTYSSVKRRIQRGIPEAHLFVGLKSKT